MHDKIVLIGLRWLCGHSDFLLVLLAFFRQLLKLRTCMSPHVIFAELAEAL